MSVKSNVERAESAMRKALINALAEGEDQHLCELFEMLMALRECIFVFHIFSSY